MNHTLGVLLVITWAIIAFCEWKLYRLRADNKRTGGNASSRPAPLPRKDR